MKMFPKQILRLLVLVACQSLAVAGCDGTNDVGAETRDSTITAGEFSKTAGEVTVTTSPVIETYGLHEIRSLVTKIHYHPGPGSFDFPAESDVNEVIEVSQTVMPDNGLGLKPTFDEITLDTSAEFRTAFQQEFVPSALGEFRVTTTVKIASKELSSSSTTLIKVVSPELIGEARLEAGERLLDGESLQLGKKYLIMHEGTLELWTRGARAWHWSSPIPIVNEPGAYLEMQNDGNLVIYAADGRVVWATGTNLTMPLGAIPHLKLQIDGNVVVAYTRHVPVVTPDNPLDGVLWDTHTHGFSWMERMDYVIADIPLRELAIPGTHESATYDLDRNRWADDGNITEGEWDKATKARPSWIERWATAQEEDIFAQLNDGIRYLDFRLFFLPEVNSTFFQQKEGYRAVHSLLGPRLEDLLSQVRAYIDRNPREIVIIDFQQVFVQFGFRHDALQNTIVELLGEEIVIPYTVDGMERTLNELWESGQQVILLYPTNPFPLPPLFWPRDHALQSKWPNKQSGQGVMDVLADDVIGNSANDGKLWVVQAVQTPDFGGILSNIDAIGKNNWRGYSSLKDVGADTDTFLAKWLDGWRGGIVWASGSVGGTASDIPQLCFQNDGNVVVSTSAGPVWDSGTFERPVTIVREGFGLPFPVNVSVIRPPGKTFVMQNDGNLVIAPELPPVIENRIDKWPAGRAVWDSSTHGNPGSELIFQGDGNLVIWGGHQKLNIVIADFYKSTFPFINRVVEHNFLHDQIYNQPPPIPRLNHISTLTKGSCREPDGTIR